MANVFEETYGQKPNITSLGTLDELKAELDAKLKAEPDNQYAWMAE